MKLVPSFALLLAAVLFSAIPGIGALSDAEMVSSCSVVYVLYMMLILLLTLLLCADTSWDYDMPMLTPSTTALSLFWFWRNASTSSRFPPPRRRPPVPCQVILITFVMKVSWTSYTFSVKTVEVGCGLMMWLGSLQRAPKLPARVPRHPHPLCYYW